MVRLSPHDCEDWSFQRKSLIDKTEAWEIIRRYITSLELTGLTVLS
jgi:hypothetical protein